MIGASSLAASKSARRQPAPKHGPSRSASWGQRVGRPSELGRPSLTETTRRPTGGEPESGRVARVVTSRGQVRAVCPPGAQRTPSPLRRRSTDRPLRGIPHARLFRMFRVALADLRASRPKPRPQLADRYDKTTHDEQTFDDNIGQITPEPTARRACARRRWTQFADRGAALAVKKGRSPAHQRAIRSQRSHRARRHDIRRSRCVELRGPRSSRE